MQMTRLSPARIIGRPLLFLVEITFRGVRRDVSMKSRYCNALKFYETVLMDEDLSDKCIGFEIPASNKHCLFDNENFYNN